MASASQMERLREQLRQLGLYVEPKAWKHINTFYESLPPTVVKTSQLDGQMSLPDNLMFKEK